MDRPASAMVNINTLEIPADLAYVISKLDDAPQVHTDSHVTAVRGHVTSPDMNYSLPDDIDSHAFNKYVNIYFKEKSQMRMEPISSPLLNKVHDRDAKEAIAIYKLILRLMHDPNLTIEREKLIADYIVQKGMATETLRDELFAHMCTQTWLNRDSNTTHRGWQLISHALSVFQPTRTFCKYLLKYVSDQAENGYKAYCQHKLLHSLILDTPLPRSYPPCLLEWKAARKQAQMALPVTFADSEETLGHVDSWTTGEEFVSHVLRQRQLADGDHGWTVKLKHDKHEYELMGYDYVLDLLAEIEVLRGFPYTLQLLLVTTDHSKDSPNDRKDLFWDSPHNPELPRLVDLTTEELRTPIPISPRPAPEPQNFFRSLSQDTLNSNANMYTSHEALSPTSKLNNRSMNSDVKPALSNSSILNVRYTGTDRGNNPSPPEPPLAASSRSTSREPSQRLSNGSAGDADKTGLSTSRLNMRYKSPQDLNQNSSKPSMSPSPSAAAASQIGLGPSRLNQRYGNARPDSNGTESGPSKAINGNTNGIANGNTDDLKLSSSKMNRRYAASPSVGVARGTAPGQRYGGDRADRTSLKSGPPTDMDQWLDQVFDPILDPADVNDLTDARTVHNRLKGGGRGLTGLTTQPSPSYTSSNVMATGLAPVQLGNVPTVPTFTGTPTGSIPLGSFQLIPETNQILAQQLVQQQQQQQARQQQQAQAILSQQAQLTAHVLQQENHDLQQQLVQSDLEKQLLAKTLEYERLNSQLKDQITATGQPVSPPAQTLPRSLSPLPSAAARRDEVHMRNVKRQAPSGPPGGVRDNMKGASGEIDRSRPGGVKTLKNRYEKSAPPLSPTLFIRDSQGFEDQASTVQFSESVQQIPHEAATSPLLQHEEASAMGIPPPPPPMPSTSNDNRLSRREEMGKAPIEPRIKVGTIQWPPPSKDMDKRDRRMPNKLNIQQKIIDEPEEIIDPHEHMMQVIRSRNTDPGAPDPVAKKPLAKIDMAERQSKLAQQLSVVGMLKDAPPLPNALKPHPSSGSVDLSALRDLEKIKTKLFSGQHGPYLTYSDVPWSLQVRKEVFTPTETIESPALVHLVFCQIAQDVFSNSCVRIPKEEKNRMKGMLEHNGVNPRNMNTIHKTPLKKMVIDTARDWPYYFARLFPVNGGTNHPAVQVVGVSHSGIKLLAREKDLFEDNLHVVDQFRFEDIIDVSEPKPTVLQIHVNNDYVILYTPRAGQIKHMINAYCIESEKNVMYVRAVKDYTTRDPTLLHFHEGDIIKLTNRNMALDKGWLYGSLYGRTGLFPEEYIKPLARHEVDKADPIPKEDQPVPPLPTSSSTSSCSSSGERKNPEVPRRGPYDQPPVSGDEIYSESSVYGGIPDVQKFSMMEFAILHFRESPYRYEMIRSEDTGSIHGTFKMISSLKAKTMQRQQAKKKGDKDWTWKEQADMIKWTRSPIQASLLKFESPNMNKIALECFISIMRYMGDYPLGRGQKPIDCVYAILKSCHNYPELRDEMYCQLAKQTTSNRSTKQESAQLGWRLLSIITVYFSCTDVLKPYLFKYLETTALDLQRPHQTLAAQCLQNLRQTFRYGGRKNVPSRVELEALTRGRNTKRQMCVMPGGVPIVLNIRSCSVVLDAIDQICARLDILDTLERDEFTIFYVIESGSRYLTLNREEYIFDITTELANQKKEFYLLFQRTSWVFPLHLENNPLYIDVMYHQCIPDYLDGFLLPLPSTSLPENIKVEIARLSALQIKANELATVPKSRDVLATVPRNVHNVPGPSWMSMVERELIEVQHKAATPTRAKVVFLEKLSRWPLFGSTFFNVKSVNDPRVKAESLLAINRAGLHYLHPNTHETLLANPFTQIVSTRRFRNKDGKNFLEMKVGDLMNQKVTRVETDQGVDISALIGQYIHILKRYRD